MRALWLAIMLISLLPAAIASTLCNPLVIVLLGTEAWRKQMRRVRPYRWWLAGSLVTLALSTMMFARGY